MSIILNHLSKAKAKNECIHQGKIFIRCFNQALNLDINSNEFDVTCRIMQLVLNSVDKLKVNFRAITNQELFDWFFCINSNINEKLNEKIMKLYVNFSLDLLNNKHKPVKAVLLNNLE